MEDETGTKAIPMASDIKTSQLCYLICACIRHYFPRRQGNRSGPQLASLRHGRLTPARISPGCPPCLRLGLGRSIIIPGGVIAKQPATGCFVDGWIRLAPYLAVFDAGFICTGGLGASSSVASAPLPEGLSSADVSRCRIFYLQGSGRKSVDHRYSQYRANWAKMLFMTWSSSPTKLCRNLINNTCCCGDNVRLSM